MKNKFALRGGGWGSANWRARSASRHGLEPTDCSGAYGLRLTAELEKDRALRGGCWVSVGWSARSVSRLNFGAYRPGFCGFRLIVVMSKQKEAAYGG